MNETQPQWVYTKFRMTPRFYFGQADVEASWKGLSTKFTHLIYILLVIRSISQWKKMCNIFCGRDWGFPNLKKKNKHDILMMWWVDSKNVLCEHKKMINYLRE